MYIKSVNLKYYSNDLKVTFLNIRSFNKHAIDLSFDERLTTRDIVCLTQTQLRNQVQKQNVFYHLRIEMDYNNYTDQFLSITMFSKYHYISQTKINGASYIEFNKNILTGPVNCKKTARHHAHLSLCAKARKTNDSKLRKWPKTSIWAYFLMISKSNIFK